MTELEIARTKVRALRLYEKWKIAQLKPLVQRWASEGYSAEEIERRLDAFKLAAQQEMQLVLQAVTIYALKTGTSEHC